MLLFRVCIFISEEQDAMALLVKEVLNKLFEPAAAGRENAVDGLKSGDPDSEVKGIAVAFMATQEVIEQAIAREANLLITHEGIFYSHHEPAEFPDDPVHRDKQQQINESGIAICRFHDGAHRGQPDGITAGLVHELGWAPYVQEHQSAAAILTVPVMSVKEIGEYVKRQLEISYVRVIGDLSMPCSRVGLLVGYRGGGRTCIPLFEQEQLDLIIAGEGPEWETPEYVRDAVHQGKGKALILLGHARSEVPGMKQLAKRMEVCFPGTPVHFLQGNHEFHLI